MVDWNAIVKNAIETAITERKGPVPGAVFVGYIKRFTDEPIPDKKLINFLSKYEDNILSIQRPEGSDILIVPHDRLDLLGKDVLPKRLRSDFYKAFTAIDHDIDLFYSPDTDRIYATKRNVPVNFNIVLVPISSTSLESELELRRRFISSLQPSEIQSNLEASLLDANPLGAFYIEAKKGKIFDGWFTFRVSEVIKSVRSWVEKHKLTWRDSWMTSVKVDIITIEESNSIYNLVNSLSKLTKEDLARITVPLDVVMALLNGR